MRSQGGRITIYCVGIDRKNREQIYYDQNTTFKWYLNNGHEIYTLKKRANKKIRKRTQKALTKLYLTKKINESKWKINKITDKNLK